MLLTSLAVVFASCPTIDLLALPSAPMVDVPAASFALELASQRRTVVPQSVFGPVDLGVDGELVAAVRCTSVSHLGRVGGSCEIVVAHLALAQSQVVLSGLVGAFDVRGKDAIIEGLAAIDLMDGAEKEVVVRWRTSLGAAVGVLRWEGFTRAWASPPGCTRVTFDDHRCAREPVLAATCARSERWQWREKRRELVRLRR